MDQKIIAANWKMYKLRSDVDSFFDVWRKLEKPKNEIVIIPQAPLLDYVKKNLTYEKLGAQNCSDKKEGAFTGEVSPYLLKDVGCDYVLIGHSERRHIFGEKNEIMGAKIKNAIEAKLRVIYCVGEKLEERDCGKTIEVIFEQLSVLKNIYLSGYDIAYEPVWAIGTGKVAKKEDASFVQGKIKDYLLENQIGKDTKILYGGSVKPENSVELLSAPNVDGLLVGGASLDPQSFYKIAVSG